MRKMTGPAILLQGTKDPRTTAWFRKFAHLLAVCGLDIDDCWVIVVNSAADVQAELDTHSMKITHLLVMGHNALKLFKGKKSISRKDGELELLGGMYVMYTYAMMEVEIQQERIFDFVNHLQYFAALCNGETKELTADYHFIFTSVDLPKIKDLLIRTTHAAYDIESTGLNPRKDKITMVGIAGRLTNGALWTGIMVPHESPFEGVPKMSANEITQVLHCIPSPVGHHSRFDNNFLYTRGIAPPVIFTDTMHISHYENELQSHKLKHLLRAKLAAEPYELGVYFGKGAPALAFETLSTYCRKDCIGTLLLDEYYEDEGYPTQTATGEHRPTCNMRGRPEIISYIMDVERLLQTIERFGVYIDTAKLAAARNEVYGTILDSSAKLEAIAASHGMGGMNYGSPAQLQKLLYDKMGIAPVYKDEVVLETDDDDEEFEDGENEHTPTTNAAALKALAHKGYAVCEEILRYRKARKMMDAFLIPWTDMIDSHGRIHPAYHSARTKTCRLSSSDPNLQQVSRDPLIRNLIAAPPGQSFIEADYSQIELRVVAVLGNIESMKRIYRAHGDIHTNTAKALALLRGEDYDSLPKAQQKAYRTKAKAVNFGFVYGMSARGFMAYAAASYDVYLTLKEAEEFRATYFRLYPELVRWHDQTRMTSGSGITGIATGRVRHIPNVNSKSMYLKGKAYRQALNTPVQGLASEFTLHGMLAFAGHHRTAAAIVGQCHDAIFIQCFTIDAEQVCKELHDCMTNIKNMPLIDKNVVWDIPLEVEIKVGKCWGDPDATIFDPAA